MKTMLKNYNEIFEIRSEGLCENCDYGFDKCLTDGRAYCKSKQEQEVKKDEQEKSV